MLIYSGEFFVEDKYQGYNYYERDAICTNCGKVFDRQIKYCGDKDFHFSKKEKDNYKYCPYCGSKLYNKEDNK